MQEILKYIKIQLFSCRIIIIIVCVQINFFNQLIKKIHVSGLVSDRFITDIMNCMYYVFLLFFRILFIVINILHFSYSFLKPGK